MRKDALIGGVIGCCALIALIICGIRAMLNKEPSPLINETRKAATAEAIKGENCEITKEELIQLIKEAGKENDQTQKQTKCKEIIKKYILNKNVTNQLIVDVVRASTIDKFTLDWTALFQLQKELKESRITSETYNERVNKLKQEKREMPEQLKTVIQESKDILLILSDLNKIILKAMIPDDIELDIEDKNDPGLEIVQISNKSYIICIPRNIYADKSSGTVEIRGLENGQDFGVINALARYCLLMYPYVVCLGFYFLSTPDINILEYVYHLPGISSIVISKDYISSVHQNIRPDCYGKAGTIHPRTISFDGITSTKEMTDGIKTHCKGAVVVN